jgi:predicted DNA binding CopG/RHH family protein
MKTKLMLSMVCLLLCGCREKTDEEWKAEIREAGTHASERRKFAISQNAKPVDIVDYQVAQQRLEAIKQRAIADGLDKQQAEIEAAIGGFDGAR